MNANYLFDRTRNYQGENAEAYLGEVLIVNDFPEPVDYSLPWTENQYKVVAYRGFKEIGYDGNSVYVSEHDPRYNYHYSRDFEWNVRGTEEKWLKGKRFYVYNMYKIERYPNLWVFEMYNIDDPEDEVSYVYHGEYHEEKDTRYGNFDLEWFKKEKGFVSEMSVQTDLERSDGE